MIIVTNCLFIWENSIPWSRSMLSSYFTHFKIFTLLVSIYIMQTFRGANENTIKVSPQLAMKK